MSPQPPVVIRRAEKRDLSALGRLGGHLVRVHHAFDRERFMAPGPGLESGYGWFLGTQLRDPDVAVFVAEQHGEVVGYVYAGVEEKSWKELRDVAGFVHDVVVDESARRGGIGSMLVEQAAAWLIERGVPRLMLWTAEKNGAAQRLFEKLGFRRTMIEMTREAKSSPKRKSPKRSR